MITLKETSTLLYILCFSSFIDSVIQAVFPSLYKILEGNTLFWIWNIKGISFNEGLFLTLPLLLDIPFESEPTKEKTDFYVSAPILLSPRQPTQSFLTSHSMQSSFVLLPNKPSTSPKVILNEAEKRNAARKQTGLILSVRSPSPLSKSPSTSSSPSFSEKRKGVSKGGRSSKLVMATPANVCGQVSEK